MLGKIVGTRVLVLLDEFDRCEHAEFKRNVAEFMKDLSDRAVRVQLVIAGVASNLTELIDHIPPIQRSLYALQTPKMVSREITELVRRGEDGTGLTFDDGAVELIVAAANGYP